MNKTPFVLLAVFACVVGCAAPTEEEEVGQSGDALQEAKVACVYSGDGYSYYPSDTGTTNERVTKWVNEFVTKECYAQTKPSTGAWTAKFSGVHAHSFVIDGPSDGKFNRCIVRALQEKEDTMRGGLKSQEACYLEFTYGPQ